MLFIATYIYTYSGDAPMDARWINLLCMDISQQTNTNQWPKLSFQHSLKSHTTPKTNKQTKKPKIEC